MAISLRLAYLVFETRKPARWDRFMREMLGLPAPAVHPDGSTGWRVDGACQRLVVVPGTRDDLLALGLECGDAAQLQQLLERLRAAGHRPLQADAALCRQRGVRALWSLHDPAQGLVELCWGLEQAATPFASAAFPDGFETGALGLGHVVLVSHDLPAMEAFYGELLGFGVTERLDTRVGPVHMRGTFLHCNRRHHSLALFDLPASQRIHHFMLQARATRDVGRAFERAEALGVPLALELGQHPDPDGTFSFYGDTPSGFAFEIGAQTREIDPAQWRTMHTQQTSAWGHRPRLRLKLRMAGELLKARLRRTRRQPARGAAL
ncbi:VOC family protein [Pseudorhodoferax sp.]|uniref:VOC family protein n=1 Tax=Pseudorhodoferax sp. TaxID=1993553 RepID=UPI002DD621A1|nr:VOC family protein [Pseudorhodoferax sp.]